MKLLEIIRLAVVVGGMVLAIGAKLSEAQENVAAATKTAPKRVIAVSLEDRKLALIEDGIVKKIYTVAVGKPTTPSPVGSFTIERRIANPTYSHEGRIVPPGPQNPVGSRWMGLSIRGYGIHGTNVPSSIGKAASRGCIRMGKADVEELFSMVQVGDTVELIGTRNEETAQLFGTPAVTPQAPQAVVASAASTTTTSTAFAGSM
jgi:lipoprotein-anchoring transpeptidase ErfK/SrfK